MNKVTPGGKGAIFRFNPGEIPPEIVQGPVLQGRFSRRGVRAAFERDSPVGVCAAGVDVGEAPVSANATFEESAIAEVAGGGGDL